MNVNVKVKQSDQFMLFYNRTVFFVVVLKCIKYTVVPSIERTLDDFQLLFVYVIHFQFEAF